MRGLSVFDFFGIFWMVEEEMGLSVFYFIFF